MSRKDYEDRMKAAVEALALFEAEHALLLQLRQDLRRAVEDAQWPPKGQVACASPGCSALHADVPTMSGGWKFLKYRCGCDGDPIYCPDHTAEHMSDTWCRHCT